MGRAADGRLVLDLGGITFINSLGVNRPLLMNDLGAVFSRFRKDGLLPLQSSLIAPVGDLYPQQSRTLRTRKENVQLLTPITTTTRL